MSFGALWADLGPLVTGTLGTTAAHPDRSERVILRRASPMFEDTAQNTMPGELQVVDDADAGATSLTLELPERGDLPAGGGMAGTLQAGARLVIGGTTYTVAVDAPTTGATLVVTFAPALMDEVEEGAAVLVHPEAVFTFEGCQISRRRKSDSARPLQADHFAVATVPCKGAPTTPRMNDSLELEDGTVGRVANEVISTGAFWKLNMGA